MSRRSHAVLAGLACLAVACAPPESAWERTSIVCGDDGWGENDPSLEYIDEEIEKAKFPSLDCIDAIIDDLHVDGPGFEERDFSQYDEGREMLLDGVSAVEEYSGLAFALLPARFLLMHDLGTVADLEPSMLVRKDVVQRLRRAGGGRRWSLQEAIYQVLVDDIDAIVPASPEYEELMQGQAHATWGKETNTVYVYYAGARSGYNSLGTLIHELRHDTGPVHMQKGRITVDIASNGSYGWEAAVLTAVRNGIDPAFREEHDEAMAHYVRGSISRIQQYRDANDDPAQPWEGFPYYGEDR